MNFIGSSLFSVEYVDDQKFRRLVTTFYKMLRPCVTTFPAKNLGKTVLVTTLRPVMGITPASGWRSFGIQNSKMKMLRLAPKMLRLLLRL